MGYLSGWAQDQFSDIREKNEFFSRFGEVFSPRGDERLSGALASTMGSDEVLDLAERIMGQV